MKFKIKRILTSGYVNSKFIAPAVGNYVYTFVLVLLFLKIKKKNLGVLHDVQKSNLKSLSLPIEVYQNKTSTLIQFRSTVKEVV